MVSVLFRTSSNSHGSLSDIQSLLYFVLRDSVVGQYGLYTRLVGIIVQR